MLMEYTKGMLGGLFLCFPAEENFEATLVIRGGPWRILHCDIRSTIEIPTAAMVTM